MTKTAPNTKDKIFIISLPRSGTTSACLYLLDCGLKVAHTAYNHAAIEAADVIADTPVFVDYAELALRYPNARFVYLERPLDEWTASIKRLLGSMRKQWHKPDGILNPVLKRCFQNCFPKFESNMPHSHTYLQQCYLEHREKLEVFVNANRKEILFLPIKDEDAGSRLAQFCDTTHINNDHALPHVNKGRRISYWQAVEHNNKIEVDFKP
ncbi:sulfotransferase [Agaribacterium sp. ZY112]|uniref:sulfotransferase n=1 Tax=Agaribacterium sp. ZY112 TaxID=3233574 RepID=UPI003524D973